MNVIQSRGGVIEPPTAIEDRPDLAAAVDALHPIAATQPPQ